MGSELFTTLKEQGRNIKRGGMESMVAAPEEYVVIGHDVTAEALLKRYPNEDSKAHARARAIIRGVRDKTRTASPPPPWFVASLSNGVRTPITVANLGPDKKGTIVFAVLLGRQRTMGLREWNRTHPDAVYDLTALLAPLAHNEKAGVDAELEALEANAESNIFIAMPPSGKADHATMLAAKKMPIGLIALRVGARDADEVGLLLDLAGCVSEVQSAVDAGRVALADVKTLAALTPAEQARRVARKAAGPSKAAKNGAAPPRPKAYPRTVVEAMAKDLEGWNVNLSPRDAAMLLRCAFGDRNLTTGEKWLADLTRRAEAAVKGKGDEEGAE